MAEVRLSELIAPAFNLVHKDVKSGAHTHYWLGEQFILEAIIIDDQRCPEAAREFMNYELEKDANGNFKARFPDKDNHAIDATRYALNYEAMDYWEREVPKTKRPYHPFFNTEEPGEVFVEW